MINETLVANRGEIASRVVTTARRLEVKTVAVYSDVDAMAVHARIEDEAVHPGHGLLIARAGFVETREKTGFAFSRPPAKAVAAMGDKIESKTPARDAG
ncbi:MAG: biotin carboxylase N-terminal domain-containing protein [Pacificimonas sp.]